MKEKISCSLDGNIVDRIDDVIKSHPIISNRSALIETACVLFIDLYDSWASYDLTEQTTFNRESNKRDEFIHHMYEMRCKMNAQKESENRNI